PRSDDARALIDGSEAAIRAVLTADECFTFTADELDRPDIRLFVARRNAQPVGCVALYSLPDYAEVKRLFVTQSARGTGTARALMAHLEAQAAKSGQTSVRLETAHQLTAAHQLYAALGYKTRSRFGNYADHPTSLFMEKHL
ncbi:MAG: GNAT family N-acetyltransferase, partial [Paracoccaceae bacterium]